MDARGQDHDVVTFLTRKVVPLLVVAGTIAALARVAARPLSNFDTYFHLRFGAEFRSGAWSLTSPGHVSSLEHRHWVPTQWLSEVTMAQFERWFGLAGVAWLAGALFCALLLAMYFAARPRADVLCVAVLLPIAAIASSNGLSMRPQVISYLLSAVTVGAWLSARDSGRVPWLLVPMTWVWAMCHGMWPVGIVVGVAAVAGLALDRQPHLLKMAMVPALSLVVTGLTPVGPRLYGAVLLVNSRGKYFTEWGPPRFTSAQGVALLLLLALALIPMLMRGQNRWFDIAMLVVVAGWCVYSERTVPPAAAMLVPLAAMSLQRLVGAPSPPTRWERPVIVGSAVVSLLGLALAVPHTSSRPANQPRWVQSALTALPEGTTVLDNQLSGGFLMWRYPHLNLVMHGYGDVYTDHELQRIEDINEVKPGWDALVRHTGATYAFEPPRAPLAYALTHGERWTVVHRGHDIELLQAPPGWLDHDLAK